MNKTHKKIINKIGNTYKNYIKIALDNEAGILNLKLDKFANFLRTFVDLEIPHIQFNVVRREDLLKAQKNPEQYSSLTVRVAGYTAYFTELAGELQNEIIARTTYDNV